MKNLGSVLLFLAVVAGSLKLNSIYIKDYYRTHPHQSCCGVVNESGEQQW